MLISGPAIKNAFQGVLSLIGLIYQTDVHVNVFESIKNWSYCGKREILGSFYLRGIILYWILRILIFAASTIRARVHLLLDNLKRLSQGKPRTSSYAPSQPGLLGFRHLTSPLLSCVKISICSNKIPGRARFSKAPETFEPVKPFLVHLYLKTNKCIRLKFLVWRESLFVLRICE